MAAEVTSDKIVVSGDAEIITVSHTEQASAPHSEIASGKPEKYKKIQGKKKKMIAREPRPEKIIQVPASAQSLRNFAVQESHCLILAMIAKASGATCFQNIAALLPLHQILLNGASLLYSRTNTALVSTVAFESSRRYTCRPPPLFISNLLNHQISFRTLFGRSANGISP